MEKSEKLLSLLYIFVTYQTVLQLVKDNPDTTQKDLAAFGQGHTERSVFYALHQLESVGLITRMRREKGNGYFSSVNTRLVEMVEKWIAAFEDPSVLRAVEYNNKKRR